MSSSSGSSTGREKDRLVNDVVRALSMALDMDEGGKLFHAWRVGVMARRIALHAAPGMADRIYFAGLLHDIGGIGLEDHIVHQAGSPTRMADMLRHIEEGERVMRSFAPFRALAPIIADHHERFDGRGFPRGASGADLTPGATIIALADTLDLAMRATPAPHRARQVQRVLRTAPGALAERAVVDAAGTVFQEDPGLVAALYDPTDLDRLVRSIDATLPEVDQAEPLELLSEMLWLFAMIIDAKHSYTAGHSERVAQYALRIGELLGIEELSRWDLLWAGLLHDVGKIGVPRRLLDAPRGLNASERGRVQAHAEGTIEVMRQIDAVAPLAYAAAAHHEHWDGSGYPRGTAGEEIPFIGRVLAYADAYDALRTDRAYRRGVSHAEAVERIRRDAGTHFDPGLLDAAISTFDASGDAKPELPRTVEQFKSFFGVARAAGGLGPRLRRERIQALRTPERDVLLLDLVPWRSVCVDVDLVLAPGHERHTAGLAPTPAHRLSDLLDAESLPDLEQMIAEAVATGNGTRFLHSAAGAPLEAILDRRPDGLYRFLFRPADNRLVSLKRLALFARNFVNTSDAVCFLDRRGDVMDTNAVWLALSDQTASDLIGTPFDALVSAEGGGPLPWSAARATDEEDRPVAGGDWRGTAELVRRGSPPIPIDLRIVILRGPRGGAIGFVAHGQDIRERRQAEARERLIAETLATLGPDHDANRRSIVDAAARAFGAHAAWYQPDTAAGGRAVAAIGFDAGRIVPPAVPPPRAGEDPRGFRVIEGDPLAAIDRALRAAGRPVTRQMLVHPVRWGDAGGAHWPWRARPPDRCAPARGITSGCSPPPSPTRRKSGPPTRRCNA